MKKAAPLATRPRDPQHIKDLVPDAHNRRQHTPRNLGLLVDALHKVGAARSIVIDEHDEVLAGNGVVEAAGEAGIHKLHVVEADGDTIVAVRRRGLTAAQKRDLALYDNRTAELATWNLEQLVLDRDAGFDLTPFWTPEELTAIASHADAAAVSRLAEDFEDKRPAGPSDAAAFQTFQCVLTTDQERVVRSALRAARTVFDVETTGEALVAALTEWVASRETPDAEDAREEAR